MLHSFSYVSVFTQKLFREVLPNFLKTGYSSKRLILSSSAVERSAVNRLVAGSNPAWGVKKSS